MLSVHESTRRRLVNMSVDEDESNNDLGMETSTATIEGVDHHLDGGIQIVDPNNRYRKPKSKFNES